MELSCDYTFDSFEYYSHVAEENRRLICSILNGIKSYLKTLSYQIYLTQNLDKSL